MTDELQPTRSPAVGGARRRLAATAVGAAVLVLVAIGGILLLGGSPDDQTDYDAAVAGRFLERCTTDARALGFADPDGFCRCSYDRISAEIPFARFVEIDATIAARAGDVPDEIAAIRRDCFSRTAASPATTEVPGTAPATTVAGL